MKQCQNYAKLPLMSHPMRPYTVHPCLCQMCAAAQMHYEKHERALEILIMICRRIHNHCRDAIFSAAEQPSKGMKVAIYRPKAVEYKNEILHCANQLESSEEDNASP